VTILHQRVTILVLMSDQLFFFSFLSADFIDFI
jgi:hypothetical protein